MYDSSISVEEAIEFFGLTPAFSLDRLRTVFKKYALSVHPDRGGSAEMFRTVNEAFEVLVAEHRARSGSTLHDQLKRDFEADVSNYDMTSRRSAPDSDSFNLVRFNEVFEHTRTRDGVRDTGYGQWFESDDDFPKLVKHPKLNPKCGSGAFNNAFEKSVPAPKNNQTAIIVMPVPGNERGCLPFTELGMDSVDDYSTDGAYDCRIAHTTQRLIDPASVKIEDNSRLTPAQVESMRTSTLAEGLSDHELRALEAEKLKRSRLDAARRDNEMRLHAEQAQAHAQANRLFLGYHPEF